MPDCACGRYLNPDEAFECEECVMDASGWIWLAVVLAVLAYPVFWFVGFMQEVAGAARRRNERKADRKAMREMGL